MYIIRADQSLLAGKWPDRHQICTRWTPGQRASRVCSRSRLRSKVTWYGHFCTGTKIASFYANTSLIRLFVFFWNYWIYSLIFTARRYAERVICYGNSVRPSVTRVNFIKTAECVIEIIISPSDSPIILVFRHQVSLCKSAVTASFSSPPDGGADYKRVAIFNQYVALGNSNR